MIASKEDNGKWKLSQGDPPAELSDPNNIKHRDIRTISLIREPLWEKARWRATVFVTMPDDQHPPILGLMFESADAAIEIFDGWRQEVGTIDHEELLRIAIIRGISATEPHSYRVAIGSDPEEATSGDPHRYVAFISRVLTMHPSSSQNLDRFAQSYGRAGAFYLAPAVAAPETATQVIWDHMIAKRKIYLRSAWEIGRHDPDSCLIRDDDMPVIPSGTAAAPITELLQTRRERHR